MYSATGEAETIYSVNALNARENVAVHSVRARCSVLIACKGFTGDRGSAGTTSSGDVLTPEKAWQHMVYVPGAAFRQHAEYDYCTVVSTWVLIMSTRPDVNVRHILNIWLSRRNDGYCLFT